MTFDSLAPTQQAALRDAIDHSSLLRCRGGYRSEDSQHRTDVHSRRTVLALRRYGLLALTELGDVAFPSSAGRNVYGAALRAVRKAAS